MLNEIRTAEKRWEGHLKRMIELPKEYFRADRVAESQKNCWLDSIEEELRRLDVCK